MTADPQRLREAEKAFRDILQAQVPEGDKFVVSTPVLPERPLAQVSEEKLEREAFRNPALEAATRAKLSTFGTDEAIFNDLAEQYDPSNVIQTQRGHFIVRDRKGKIRFLDKPATRARNFDEFKDATLGDLPGDLADVAPELAGILLGAGAGSLAGKAGLGAGGRIAAAGLGAGAANVGKQAIAAKVFGEKRPFDSRVSEALLATAFGAGGGALAEAPAAIKAVLAGTRGSKRALIRLGRSMAAEGTKISRKKALAIGRREAVKRYKDFQKAGIQPTLGQVTGDTDLLNAEQTVAQASPTAGDATRFFDKQKEAFSDDVLGMVGERKARSQVGAEFRKMAEDLDDHFISKRQANAAVNYGEFVDLARKSGVNRYPPDKYIAGLLRVKAKHTRANIQSPAQKRIARRIDEMVESLKKNGLEPELIKNDLEEWGAASVGKHGGFGLENPKKDIAASADVYSAIRETLDDMADDPALGPVAEALKKANRGYAADTAAYEQAKANILSDALGVPANNAEALVDKVAGFNGTKLRAALAHADAVDPTAATNMRALVREKLLGTAVNDAAEGGLVSPGKFKNVLKGKGSRKIREQMRSTFETEKEWLRFLGAVNRAEQLAATGTIKRGGAQTAFAQRTLSVLTGRGMDAASAGTGALLGAAAGSVIPGVGTGAGALTGAGVGAVATRLGLAAAYKRLMTKEGVEAVLKLTNPKRKLTKGAIEKLLGQLAVAGRAEEASALGTIPQLLPAEVESRP